MKVSKTNVSVLRNLIQENEKARFFRLEPLIVIKDTLISWALIFSSWFLVASYQNLLTVCVDLSSIFRTPIC